MAETDNDAAIAAREDAELASGFTDLSPPPPKPEAKPDAAAKPDEPVRAAAAKTASYDAQLSKLFGSTGNLQTTIKGLQERTQAGRKVEIPKDAFERMSRDFPELAEQTREALERALSGMTGTGTAAHDPAALEAMLARHTAAKELEVLEDAYPEWRKIVGAVDVTRERPDPKNPFRRWLAGQDAAYQNRINNSESAAVIARAIRRFQSETKGGARPFTPERTPNAARADRIRQAVQPRGDNAVAAAGPTDDEMFEAGFRSR